MWRASREIRENRGSVGLARDIDQRTIGIATADHQSRQGALAAAPKQRSGQLSGDMFTAQEIAYLLGKTEAAVRQNLRAARKRLAGSLGGEAR